ncbi:hypothetical protein LC612_35365 [Nostoc sp. CHAB 5834]|nr:hypothetical protein [Nostoc sp. CHAB 5834]
MSYHFAADKPLTLEKPPSKQGCYQTRDELRHDDFMAGVRGQSTWVMAVVVLCWGLALCEQWLSTGSLEGGVDRFSANASVVLHLLGVVALWPLLRLRYLGEPKSWAYRSNAYVAGRHLASVGYLVFMVFAAVLAQAPLMALQLLVLGAALHFKSPQKTVSLKAAPNSCVYATKQDSGVWRAFAVSAAVLRMRLACVLGLGMALLASVLAVMRAYFSA